MKKIIFCLSAVLSLVLLLSLTAFADTEFTEKEAKALETVTDKKVCDCLGDCDIDGAISIADARKALRGAIGIEELTSKQKNRADITGDGKVKVADARKILRIAIGTEKQKGHKTVEISIIPATCSTMGYSIKYCTVCQKKYSEESEYNTDTHLSGWVTETEATCQSTGLKQYKCQLCGKVLKEKVIAISDHNYTAWVYPNGNDCTVITERYRTCKTCGYKQEDTRTPRDDHYMSIKAKAATCTETGYWKCKYCDATEVIPATGHLYNSFEYTVYKTPTCTETGLKAQLCVNCKEPRTDTITTVPALGHSYDYTKQTVLTAPTCSTTGKAKVSCTLCGKVYKFTLEKTEHTFTKDWSVTKEATCTTDGIKTAVCKYCSTITEVIPATGHSLNLTEVAATCKATGLKTWTCSNCDYIKTEVTDKLDHSYPTEIKKGTFCIIDIEPTCTEKGQATLICKVCGEKKTVTLAIDSSNHSWSTSRRQISEATCQSGSKSCYYCTRCDINNEDTIRTNNDKVDHKAGDEWVITQAPTCTINGSREKQCIYCKTALETEEIAATGHVNTTVTKGSYDVNGVCNITVICDDCKQTIKEDTFAKVVIKGGTVKFTSDSTTSFKPGDIIIFTVEETAIDSISASCGINTDSVSEENGVYKYTIPEDTEDDDVITFNIYTSYEEEED